MWTAHGGIPLLGALPYQMFLRPRRFGKSLPLSIPHYNYTADSFVKHCSKHLPEGVQKTVTSQRNFSDGMDTLVGKTGVFRQENLHSG